MKHTREPIPDFVGEQRQSMIMKARQNLGLNKRNNSSRREITMPEEPPQPSKPQLPSPGMSATVGKRRPPTGVQRQKTSGLNSDIPTDLLLEAHSMLKTGFRSTSKLGNTSAAQTPIGNKARKPLPKRGKSAHPAQRQPVSQNDLTKFSWSHAVSGATNAHLAYNSSTAMR